MILTTILVSIAASFTVCLMHMFYLNKQMDRLLNDLSKAETDFMEQIKSIVLERQEGGK